jgi:hypothetical protein
MIQLIEGRGVGAGKSYFLVNLLLPHWAMGGTCCVSDTVVIHWDEVKKYIARTSRVHVEDDQYRTISSADLARLHEVTPPGSDELPVIIAVDEAQAAFNARDWADKSKRPFFDWLCQSRHDDNDVIIISQSQANVDKQVRRLCTYIWVIRNANDFPLLGFKLGELIRWATLGISDGRFFRVAQLDQDGRTKLNSSWLKFRIEVGRCYKSKSMQMAHRRAGQAILKKKLQRVEPNRKGTMLKIGIFFIVGALIFVGYRFTHMHPAKDIASKNEVQPQGTNGKADEKTHRPVEYDTTGEHWLYREGNTVKTESGTYTLGRMSRRGMVEGIADGVIRYRKPDGNLGYIVTEDYNVPAAPERKRERRNLGGGLIDENGLSEPFSIRQSPNDLLTPAPLPPLPK